MATPVGWVGAIVISAGTAYSGKKLGEFGVSGFYDVKGDVLNLKDGRLLNSWCK